MNLDATQQRAIYDLSRKLAKLSTEEVRAQADGLVQIQRANTFGVLGPRGAGKSTILSALHKTYCLLRSKEPRNKEIVLELLPDLGDSLNGLFILPPFDCSIVSRDLPPGAAALLHLERELRTYAEESPRGTPLPEGRLFEELICLIERYSKATDKYTTLAMELATTSGEYTHTVTEAAKDRLSLRAELKKWLLEVLSQLKRSAFVILLDDFDLVHGQEVRNWFSSLLDEMSQERLLIVLTADFYRLEHLIWDPGADIDDMTGRHLLNKLLPVQNRVHLDEWGSDDRRKFLLGLSLGNRTQDIILEGLLPSWPRGLMDLVSLISGDKGVLPSLADASQCKNFLSILASCRGEPLLARELMLKPLESWGDSLDLVDRPVSAEEWSEAVEVARERGTEDGHGLVPAKPISILRPKELERPEDFHLLAVRERDPAARDALRHDALRVLPLRDADAKLLPAWVELLLNFGFMNSPMLSREDATRNCLRFVNRWQPVALRFSRARIGVQMNRQNLRSFFEDQPAPAAALLWLRWQDGIDSELSIGWDPFLLALRGARSHWQVRPITELMIDPRGFTGELPKSGDAATLQLIPDQVWAIILLADSLDRCPWEALSLPLGWELRTYLVLAILLVRTAYAHALMQIKAIDPAALCRFQAILLDTLREQDPSYLLRLREEEILGGAREMLDDGLVKSLEQATDPISVATRSFLGSVAYRALRDLLPPGEAAAAARLAEAS